MEVWSRVRILRRRMKSFDCQGDESECYRRVKAKTEATIRAPVRAPEISRVSENNSERRSDDDRESVQWYTHYQEALSCSVSLKVLLIYSINKTVAATSERQRPLQVVPLILPTLGGTRSVAHCGITSCATMNN